MGVQSHHKATPKRQQSHIKATSGPGRDPPDIPTRFAPLNLGGWSADIPVGLVASSPDADRNVGAPEGSGAGGTFGSQQAGHLTESDRPLPDPTALELRQKWSVAWLPPLPAERGDGWGEGSILATGIQRRKDSLGPPLPSPLLPRGRRGRSRRVSRGNFLNSTAVLPGPLARLRRKRGRRPREQCADTHFCLLLSQICLPWLGGQSIRASCLRAVFILVPLFPCSF